MYVHVVFEHEVTGLKCKKSTMFPITRLNPEKYLRNYLEQAMNYTNVLDYFQIIQKIHRAKI